MSSSEAMQRQLELFSPEITGFKALLACDNSPPAPARNFPHPDRHPAGSSNSPCVAARPALPTNSFWPDAAGYRSASTAIGQ